MCACWREATAGLLSILSAWTQELKDDRPLQLVNLTTDLHAITVKRAVGLEKPRSFVRQLLSDEGVLLPTGLPWQELGDFLTCLARSTGYVIWTAFYEERMRNQT